MTPRLCKGAMLFLPALFLLVPPLTVLANAAPLARNEVTLEQYRQLIQEYRDVTSLPSASGARVENLRNRLRQARVVVLSADERRKVDNAPLLRGLELRLRRNTPFPQREREEQRMAAEALVRLLTPLEVRRRSGARADAATIARSVLSREEFRKARTRRPEAGWMEKLSKSLLRAIEDFIEWLQRMLGGGRPGNIKPIPGLAEFVLYTLYTVAAVGTLIGGYFILQKLRWQRTHPDGAAATIADAPMGPGEEQEDPLSVARVRADRGEYRAAIRLVYIASLRRLAGAGLLTLAKDRTNGEYQRALRKRSAEAYTKLLPLTRLFDEVWYGLRPATRDKYERAVAAHDTLPEAPQPQERQS